MGKKIISLFFVLFSTITGAFCGSLNFQIVQVSSKLSEVSETTLVVEDELMNYFFDCGFIATNSPAAVSNNEEKTEKLYKAAYAESLDGGAEFFVQINLIMSNSVSEEEKSPALGSINKVNWKLVSLKTGKVIENKTKNIEKVIGIDSEANVRDFAADLAYNLRKSLRQA